MLNLITNFQHRSPIDLLRRTSLSLFLSNLISSLSVFTPCIKYSFINRPDQEPSSSKDTRERQRESDRGSENRQERCLQKELERGGLDRGSENDQERCLQKELERGGLCRKVQVGEVDICVGGSCVQDRLEMSRVLNSAQIVLLKCLQSYPCNAHEISELQITQQFR